METKLKIHRNGYVYSHNVKLEITESRIKFVRSPFAIKDEIKAMKGPKWHGYDKEDPQMIWSVDNCPRNVFQLQYLMGNDVYAHFDRELLPAPADIRKEALEHQIDMVRRGLTYHFQIFAAEQGLGKSLVAIMMAELTGGNWWYVGPKSAGESFELELLKWNVDRRKMFPEILTYEGLQKKVKYENFPCPQGVFFDECTAVKTGTTNRAKAAQYLADKIREETSNAGYVILGSGTPTAKSPADIWSQAEVAWPGFLREGSEHAFKVRYGHMTQQKNMDGVVFHKMEGWKEEEIEALPERTRGLMTTYRKSDWLNLPPKRFRRVHLEPSKKVLRVAAALTHVAPNAAVALTWLRALSSGFQYVTNVTGQKECQACNMMPEDYACPLCNGTKMVDEKTREPRMVKTPKCDALRAEIQGQHRVIIPASFTGSIDRCFEIANSEGFAICRVDGRGWSSFDDKGKLLKKVHPLAHWKNWEGPVAFIGNPGSCRFGLTLVEAKKMIFFDNDFSAENRLQMIDRFHRIGQTESPEVVDLCHLPVDDKVLDILDSNRSLELLSLGAIAESLGEDPEEIDLE